MNLLESFQQHGGKAQKKHTHQHGESGYFGVIEQIPIPFHHLSDLFWTFHEGKQYTMLNSYRSAPSATLHHIDGRPVGQHPIVCRLLQGMFNERPPAPRYHQVWNVSLVVRLFQTGQPTSELTLKELSKKLVTLLALCNASRASDIRALDIRFKQSTGEGVKFVIPGLTKTRCSGPQRENFFRAFNEADSLCPVKTLDIYVEKTAQLRVKGSQLVISFRKPHNPVTSASISQWVKETLADAGANTNMFKGHSI